MEVVGQRIKLVRPMTTGELKGEGWVMERWQTAPVVLELENGVRLFASQDDEGNGPGALFGMNGKQSFQLYVPAEGVAPAVVLDQGSADKSAGR